MIDIGVLAGKITLDDQGSVALKAFAGNLSDIGGSLTAAGSSLTLGITAPLVAAAGASLLFSSNFEATTTRLVSLAGVASNELAGVREHILDLAPAVGVGPQALADAMMKISSTTRETGVALEILDISAKGSAAGMGAAVDVAGALTAVINSYGSSNITAARAADILTKTVQDGGAEAKELAPVLANVIPIAAQMGVSFEQVGANIATVTKLGVPASEAVTQLSSVFSSLLKETKKGTESLSSIGMSYASLRAEIREKGLAAALLHLQEQFTGNETAMAHVFGRIEGLRNIMSTAGQQADTYAEEIQRITDSAGAADIAFDAMKDTQVQTWNSVTAALGVAAIQFGDALAPAMKAVLNLALPLIGMMGDLAKWFGDLPVPIQAIAIGFGALLAALGPVLYITGSLITAISTIIPVAAAAAEMLGGMATVVAILTNPITIAIAAAVALYAALEYFGLLTPVLNFFKDVAAVVGGVFMEGFRIVAPYISEVAKLIGGVLLDVVKGALSPLTILYEGMKLFGNAIKDYVLPYLRSAREQLGYFADKFREGSGPIAASEAGLKKFRQGLEDFKNPLIVDTGLITQLSDGTKGLLEVGTKHVFLTKEQIAAQEAHAKKLAAVNEKIAEAMRDVGNLTDKQKQQVDTLHALGLSNDDIATKLDISALAISAYEKQIKAAAKAEDEWIASMVKTRQELDKLKPKLGGMGFKMVHEDVTLLKADIGGLNGGLTVAGDTVKTIIPLFGKLPNVIAGGTEKIKEAKAAIFDLGKEMREGLTEALKNIPNLLISAFTGGGGIGGALKAIGTQIAMAILTPLMKGLSQAVQIAISAGAAITTAVGQGAAGMSPMTATIVGTGTALLGAAIGAHTLATGMTVAATVGTVGMAAMTMGIGLAAIGVYALVKHYLRVSQAEKDARKEFEAYQKQFGTLDQMIDAVGKAYAYMGLSGERAQHDLAVALDATHHSAQQVHDALLVINNVLNEAKLRADALAVVDDKLKTLLSTVEDVGIGLPDALRPMVESLAQAGGLTDELRGALNGLLANATPNFAKLESMAKGYGIELEGLGSAFQQAHVTDEAAKIISDFQSLKAAGADVNGVLRGMADEVSKVVQESIQFGTTIPENMRPMIESLIDSGLLLGADKQKITDISSLHFGEAVKTDVEKLADAIKALSDAISKIPDGIHKIPTTVPDPFQNWQIPDMPHINLPQDFPQPDYELSQQHAKGGRVLAFRASGSDTVPAMLTPGEGIVTVAGMSRIGSAGLKTINEGKVLPFQQPSNEPQAPIEITLNADIYIGDDKLGTFTEKVTWPQLKAMLSTNRGRARSDAQMLLK